MEWLPESCNKNKSLSANSAWLSNSRLNTSLCRAVGKQRKPSSGSVSPEVMAQRYISDQNSDFGFYQLGPFSPYETRWPNYLQGTKGATLGPGRSWASNKFREIPPCLLSLLGWVAFTLCSLFESAGCRFVFLHRGYSILQLVHVLSPSTVPELNGSTMSKLHGHLQRPLPEIVTITTTHYALPVCMLSISILDEPQTGDIPLLTSRGFHFDVGLPLAELQ